MKDRRTRLYVMLSILAVVVVSAAIALPNDLLFAARWSELSDHFDRPQKVSSLDTASLRKNDIPLGSPFPIVGAAAELRRLAGPSKHGYLVTGLGSCASCIQFSLPYWDRQSHEIGVPLLAFTPSSVKDVKLYRKSLNVLAPVVTDPGDLLSRSLNCYWGGRVYHYDGTWKLDWQMQWEESGKYLHQCKGLEKLLGGAK